MNLHLQKCRPTDLKQLVLISRKTFADAFEEDNNPKDFEAYTDVAFSDDRLSEELHNPDSVFFFVYQNADLVGYLKLNENDAQTDLKSKEGMELERIYILEAYQGQQIGSWMLSEAKKIAYGSAKSFLWLGVWEKNIRAIRFYQNHGFSKFGTHPYYIGDDKQTDWLMRYELIS